MKIFNILACVALVAGMISCSSREYEPEMNEAAGSVKVNISAVIDQIESRGPLEGTKFPSGSEIGVFVLRNDSTKGYVPYHDYNCENIMARKVGNEWVTSKEIRVSNDTTAYMVAYYPYSEDYEWEKRLIQISPFDDIMYSTLQRIGEDGNVYMYFHHIYCCLNFNVRKGVNYRGAGVLNSIRVDNAPRYDVANQKLTDQLSRAVREYKDMELRQNGNWAWTLYDIKNDATNVPSYLTFTNTYLSESKVARGSMMIAAVKNTDENLKECVNIKITVDDIEYVLKTFAPVWMDNGRYTYNILVDDIDRETVITISEGTIEGWQDGGSKDKDFEL